MNERALIALTRIERAASSYCCADDSDVEGILRDVLRFAKEGIASFDSLFREEVIERAEQAKQ